MVGPLRRAARRVALFAVLAAGVVALPAVRRRAPERRARLVRRWAGAVAAAAGVRVRVTGVPAAGPVLVVANHVSWLDVPLLAAVAPGRMLAKREVGDYPVVGPLAARGGTLFIDRERLRALPETVGALTRALRAGSTVAVFPEGSTWCGRERGAFRPAVFQAALDAGVPVQPVALRYPPVGGRPGVPADRATQAAFVGDDTLVASLRRVVAARGLVAEVTVLPPLPAGAHPDRRALARAAQRAVVAALTGEGGEGYREREPVGERPAGAVADARHRPGPGSGPGPTPASDRVRAGA
ncbi:lysophospholipid acyltransferase family protein [Streptomyces carminius]|uniref:lysophospholipid acyltransferase family protein n=1 Tax=Streptomyces carminius TaxID=2665496 RepID=UPI001E4B8C17|nr:lysophospholipid acyltransferase family protein [Streptomyces carminius]